MTEKILKFHTVDSCQDSKDIHGFAKMIFDFFFYFSDYLTDPSDSDEGEMFTSQATQGYSEGLADNEQESEVSSIFGIDPGVPNIPPNGESSHLSPLEYSAMLKLYRTELENGRTGNGTNR